nr:MAG TPA: hypothetical protein [Caudoviricetes sp.]
MRVTASFLRAQRESALLLSFTAGAGLLPKECASSCGNAALRT